MSVKSTEDNGLKLSFSDRTTISGQALNAIAKLLSYPLGVERASAAFKKLAADDRPDVHYFQKVTEAFGLEIDAAAYGLDKVPKEGPVAILSNHPLSGIEGIAIAAYLAKVRPDIKIVLNSRLAEIPGLKEHAILVNTSETPDAKRENIKAYREMNKHAANGGAFLIFPFGAVSYKLDLEDALASDGPWQKGTAAVLTKNPETKVIVINVANQPSDAISVAKNILPSMALPFILHDLTKNIGTAVSFKMSMPIPATDLANLQPEEMMAYLRARMISLGSVAALTENSKKETKTYTTPIGEAIDPSLLKEEFDRHEVFFDIAPDKPNKGVKVYVMKGRQIPHILKELGRLREIAFRAVSEGSGNAYDNDQYDPYYYHLVAVDKESGKIAGAYRLGRVDEIIAEHGVNGIYSRQFFNFDALKEKLFKAIELGRSFVLPEFQRRSLALPALWGAIGKFLAENPQYEVLMGPVSISNEYPDNSKLLMVEFLKKYFGSPLSKLVSAKTPPHYQTMLKQPEIDAILEQTNTLSSLDKLVQDITSNTAMKVPPLIPMYIGLGTKFLGFNFDKDFNTIDGFIWTYMPDTPFDSLKKYMGEEAAASYLRYHHVQGF
jgi:putative hemolysin